MVYNKYFRVFGFMTELSGFTNHRWKGPEPAGRFSGIIFLPSRWPPRRPFAQTSVRPRFIKMTFLLYTATVAVLALLILATVLGRN
jgi:hypothetical protein